MKTASPCGIKYVIPFPRAGNPIDASNQNQFITGTNFVFTNHILGIEKPRRAGKG
ncbi:MAG: hypothetical protein M2R45_05245 [Verrucomicrobia subdivision 3 bacterium]|nr:hypothetical protein [Limisphaerales bacterium]MCS1416844.1 hypothetical protein [Limisphaerales bacterium]